jgi:hypothetical protein
VGLINHSQYLRVRLSRIGIDRDHLAARIALAIRVVKIAKPTGS